MAASIRWYHDVLRLATRYGRAARALAERSRVAAVASGRRVLAVLPGLRPSRHQSATPDSSVAAEAVAMESAEARKLTMEVALAPALDPAPSEDSATDEVDVTVQPLTDEELQAVSAVLYSPAQLSGAAADVDELMPATAAQEVEDAEVVHDEPDDHDASVYAGAVDAPLQKLEALHVARHVARVEPDAPTEQFTIHEEGADPMPSLNQSLVPLKKSADSLAPILFTVRGNSAQIEGAFADAEVIEVHGDVSGDLRVGGLLIIGESATVSANATAANIRVEGEFTGDLRATECVEIASSGTVNGSVKCDELVIERGGIFNGTATRTARSKAQAATNNTRDRNQSRQDASRQDSARAESARAPLADIATQPATSVLDFSSDDDSFGDDSSRRQSIPLA